MRHGIALVDKQRWQFIQSIFRHLADKSPSHRRDYLDMVCEEDLELRREIEALLASHDKLEQGDQDFITPALITPALQAVNRIQLPQSLGEYRILKELGRGGMGVVYLAEHPQYDKVALKLLPRFTVEADEAQHRFSLEARILSNLDHPGLSHMFESFTTDEYAAIAMEFIDGKGLDELIKQGPLPFEQGLNIILDLCEVLHLAHTQGLAHRDIKSNNVLLDRQGQTKLIDFGIAKFADTKLTATGQILGTPSYMSPEQWRGRGVDYRADLWSLGIMLFELLTAQKPFTATDRFAVANKILNKEAPSLPATSCDGEDLVPVQAILDQLLIKEPQNRLGSCAKLSALLGKLV
ncbi:serine/threonine protein kinase [Candidatus Thiodiazotropha sp. CDECU1]|uniref:serine/threonine protein kinase n=1 Tax=Candidatus Thiodiazotropha sp. CDECU1 TaxID=3065865 RepID=UPI00292CAF8B|nr:serine/threonine-protein kinase [Candidatus Thiodiazotropha sp. CDECU1]